MMNSLVETGGAGPLEPGILLTAAVALVARRTGTRMLAFKGVAAVQYGLRPVRASSDVDVFADPARFDRLVESLQQRGWIARPSDPDTETFPRHSVSLFHPEWGTDIDVHFRYPGIELSPAESFERLWLQRTTLWCGNQPVQIPGFADAVLIAALHSLRGISLPRHAAELEALVSRCSTVDAEQLVARAGELNALATARPFLEQLVPARPGREWGEPSTEWQLRTRVPEPMQRRALHWKQAGWRDRARQLRLALVPPVDALIKESTRTRIGPLAAARAYLRRWQRGFAALPSIVPILLNPKGGGAGSGAPVTGERPPRAPGPDAGRTRP